jgi:ADP-L-glycero-D-manno-heptose 6-epimerase
MRTLVTGGAGFIGSNLALELQERGEVVVLDDFSSADFRNLEGFRGELVLGRVQDSDWHAKVGAADAVLHQAALTDTTVTEARPQLEANLEGLRSVLRFVQERKVRRLVYASSAGVYGNAPAPFREDQPLTPHNAYGFSKAQGDHLARAFWEANRGTTVVGLRYFNVYGPREAHKGVARSMVLQLAQQMKAGRRPRIFKHGEQARDWVYVKDVVEANLKALEAQASCVVNVGAGKAESYNRIIEILNGVLGTSFEPEYFDNPYAGYQNLTLADVSLARELIGFTARWSLEEGARDYLGGARVPVAAGR